MEPPITTNYRKDMINSRNMVTMMVCSSAMVSPFIAMVLN